MRRSLLALALLFAGCHSSGQIVTPDAGTPVVDSGPIEDDDAGVVLKNPPIADTFGPNTGAYDVNGSGRLLVLELDGRLALEVTDPQDQFLGVIDGGAFFTETVFPAQEDCGPVTLDGFFDGGTYQATKVFCANGTQVSGPISGARLLAPNVYRQNLAWSGAYDATESPSPSNGCATFTGSSPLTIGVARDLDGGGASAFLFGDGVREGLVFGSVSDATGIFSANALDATGNATDGFTLFFIEDGGVSGTRVFDLGTPGNPCIAHAEFFGAKR